MKPSIFNDVIGPVMRGPSSSHVAAALRIGKIIKNSTQKLIERVDIYFDSNGSLAESYHGHGSDLGIISGFLDLELTDEKVINVIEIAKELGLDIRFHIENYGAVHPNNYKIKVKYTDESIDEWEAISTGGGMIKIFSLNDFTLEICGDFYEYLFYVDNFNEIDLIKDIIDFEYLNKIENKTKKLLQIKTSYELPTDTLNKIENILKSKIAFQIIPILPILSSRDINLPFYDIDSLMEYTNKNHKNLFEAALKYEACRGKITEEEVLEKMKILLGIFIKARDNGLKKKEYKDRILNSQAYLIEENKLKNKLLPTDLINNVVKNITAIMEEKSSMGVIIAAPTAGSCGCLPGTLLAIVETYNLTIDKLLEGLFVAGIIGVFIADKATFAAEVAGCQVECGSGSAMAAAAITSIFGGSIEQCLNAASLAFQNITGLVCDPVAGRVEVPCLGKNIMGGSNAIVSATMALANFDAVIPLDEVIISVLEIGKKLPEELRCTFGGLGKTPTSLKIKEKLEN